jgi:hypothetical protein
VPELLARPLTVTELGDFEWQELGVRIKLRSEHSRAMTVALPPTVDRPVTARVAMHVDAATAEHAIPFPPAGVTSVS